MSVHGENESMRADIESIKLQTEETLFQFRGLAEKLHRLKARAPPASNNIATLCA